MHGSDSGNDAESCREETFTEHAEGGLATCDVRQRAEPEGAQLAASAANKIFSLWPRRLSA